MDRYGDDAHLDSTLDALGLKLPQKKYPKLQTLIQEETDKGMYGREMDEWVDR